MNNEVLRGQRADALLNDELFIDAFDHIRTQLMNDFANSKTNDIQAWHETRLSLDLLDKVHNYFVDVINNGKIVEQSNAHKIQQSEYELSIDREVYNQIYNGKKHY